MIADWIDAELRNWARWCWSGAWPHPIPPDHCASIEHRWIDPSDLYKEAPEPRPIPPNRQRAERVDRVYMDLLSDRERLAVKTRYVLREKAPWEHMGVPKATYEAAMLTVARLVGDAFRERAA